MTQRKCRLFLVDAFTRERFCGNPAVVVLDADELTDDEMRRIAREMNGDRKSRSSSARTRPTTTSRCRFFSPRREVTFVGHATVAAHYVRALADGVPQGKVRQKSGAGIVEVEVSGKAPDLRVSIYQTPATFGPVVPEERIGPGARRARHQLVEPASQSAPMQVMSKANSRLLIGLQSPEMLDSLQPQDGPARAPHAARRRRRLFRVCTQAGPGRHDEPSRECSAR